MFVSTLRSPPTTLSRPLRIALPSRSLGTSALAEDEGGGVCANRSSSSSEIRLDMLDDGDCVRLEARGVGMSAREEVG